VLKTLEASLKALSKLKASKLFKVLRFVKYDTSFSVGIFPVSPNYSWVFVMKSQNTNRIGKHRSFLMKELLPNFELNKFRAFSIIVGSLALE